MYKQLLFMDHKRNSKRGLSFILKTNTFWRIRFYLKKSIKLLKEISLFKLKFTLQDKINSP